ncbi:MAG: hypothetical protein HN655_00395 [Candidatus Marinimicrobia bacterium]|nr:hypothetical protein [Candidatus Neomarinimicrobiota bacterium]MBT7514295.1 hypothetical protein [Candidatus Neomarinimicrobiota bacterium]
MKNLNKMIRILPIFFLTVMLFAQKNQDEITGIWEFQTITTIFISYPNENTMTDKNINDRETLTFRSDGTFSYRGIYENVDAAGNGLWNISGDMLTLNVNNQKVVSQYECKKGILLLSVNEAETDDYYESNSIIKYKKNNISPKANKKNKTSK